MNEATDEEAVWDRVRRGDADAFGAVFDEHYSRVYGHALRMSESTHDAEDTTAIVFLEAWRRREAVRVVNGSVLAWLLVTATNVARNSRRSAQRKRVLLSKLVPSESSPDPAAEILEQLDRTAQDASLRAAFRRLSTADQKVLGLCVINDFSLTAAAEVLGVPVGTVKSRLSRAKARLAKAAADINPHISTPASLGEVK